MPTLPNRVRRWWPVLCVMVALPTRAELVELPAVLDLEEHQIELDLRGGQIEVVIDPDLEPSLEVRDYTDSQSNGGFVVVEPGPNRSLRISQAYGADQIAPRLAVRLVLHPSQQLAIKGSDLGIAIEDHRPLPTDEESGSPDGSSTTVAGTDGAAGSPALTISVDDSEAQLTAVRGARLGGTRTRYRLRRTLGAIRGELERGTLEADEHFGPIEFIGKQSELNVAHLNGTVRGQADGGTIAVREGRGAVRIVAVRPSRCEVEAFAGAVSLELTGGAARLARSGTAEALLDLRGIHTDWQLEQLPGGINVNLTGGSMTMDGLGGRALITGDGAPDLVLTNLADGAELRLPDGGEVLARKIARRLTVRQTGGRIEAEAVGDLDLTAKDGTVVLRDVRSCARLEATDAELEIDLSQVVGYPSAKLSGRTRGQLRLRSPCQIRFDGDEDAAAQRLDNQGCELLTTGNTSSGPRIGGGAAPQLVTLSLDGDAQITVLPRAQ